MFGLDDGSTSRRGTSGEFDGPPASWLFHIDSGSTMKAEKSGFHHQASPDFLGSPSQRKTRDTSGSPWQTNGWCRCFFSLNLSIPRVWATVFLMEGKECLSFSRMHSEGFSFNSGGLGVGSCSRHVVSAFATVRRPPQ